MTDDVIDASDKFKPVKAGSPISPRRIFVSSADYDRMSKEAVFIDKGRYLLTKCKTIKVFRSVIDGR